MLSLICVGDALSHVRSVKDDLQLRRVLVLVSSDARVALTVCPTTSGVGRSSFQSWTSNEHHGRLQLRSWEAWTKDYDESTGTTAPRCGRSPRNKARVARRAAARRATLAQPDSELQTGPRAHLIYLVLTRRDPWFGGEKKLKSGEAIPTELDALQESQKIMSIPTQLFQRAVEMSSPKTPKSCVLCEKGALSGNATTAVSMDTRSLNAERRMDDVSKKGGKGKNTSSWEHSDGKGIPSSWSLCCKGQIFAMAGAGKEAAAGQVGSRQEGGKGSKAT